MNKKLRAHLMLLLTALIWGVAFVAQEVAMGTIQPFFFNGARMLLAGLALLPFVRKSAKLEKPAANATAAPAERKMLWQAGFWCGVMLFLGSGFQQLGVQQTSAGKAGFVTALYIVLVPLVGLFAGKRVRWLIGLAVALCTAGLFLLCVTETLEIGTGDIYLLLCAFAFTGHILVIDYFSARVNCMRMSCIQFFTCGALSLLAALIWESPTWSALWQSWIPILYAGVMSGAVGYTMQIIGQRDTDPTVASLIMSLESVFAVLAGFLILGGRLTPRELSGCALMFAGILLAQWPEKRMRKSS